MPSSYEDRILRVLAHIHDNPTGDLSLDALADVAAMSRFHWHRVYRAMTGETCAQTVRRMRLHRAATALVQTSAPPARIAADVGYPNAASFARAFAEAYGASPAAFRKAGRLLPPFPTLKHGENPMHPVTIRTEPTRRVAALLHRGPYPEIGRAFESFAAICSSRGMWPRLGTMIAMYLDNPDETEPDVLRSYAGAELREGEVPEGLEELTLPGGRYAVMTYKGPYSGLHDAYQSLFGDWLPGSGEEPGDAPCYETYLNDPRSTAPADLLTELRLPLADPQGQSTG